MSTYLFITGGLMFLVGALKFLWNKLWNEKPWFPKFNFWYGKLMIAATLLFIGGFIYILIKTLIQKI